MESVAPGQTYRRPNRWPVFCRTLTLASLALLTGAPAAMAYDQREGREFHDAYAHCEAIARDGKRDRAKRLEEARACLSLLDGRAKRPDTRAELDYRRAEWLERLGQHRAARAEFLAIASRDPRAAMAARARFRAARLLEDELGEPAVADEEYRSLVREAPESTAALNALVHIEERLREQHPQGQTQALVEFYDRELSARPRSPLAPTLLARLGEHALSDPQSAGKAVRVFDILARDPASPKYDDALFLGAKARALVGDINGALERLERLVQTRERTPIPNFIVPGDLHSGKLDDARFFMAELLRDKVGDKKRARYHFELLLDESPTSRLADDALAALAVIAVDLGDRSAAAQYYKRLLAQHPHSRHAAQAKAFSP